MPDTTEQFSGRLLNGRYRVGTRVGRGGMAEVYEGTDERLTRQVALKVLRPEVAADQDLRRRFEVEARAAARLSHPNVVAVYDVGEDAGTSYIVMELVTGGTLAQRIRTGRAAEPAVIKMATDVLGGLAAAHAAGLIHRDVKPGNVLFNAAGTAKLADFGIAKAFEAPTGPPGEDLTATNVVLGTPAYVSPERVEGAPATASSDLWAVGVMMYESLTGGARPFQGDSAVATFMAAREGRMVPLESVRPGVSPALASVINRVLSPRPADRYASAAEMAVALRAAAGGTVDPAATRVMPPVPVPVEATRVLPGPPMGLPPTPATGVVEEWQQTPPERDPRVIWGVVAGLIAVLIIVLIIVLLALRGDGHKSPTTTLPVAPTTVAPTTPTTPVATAPATTPPTTSAPTTVAPTTTVPPTTTTSSTSTTSTSTTTTTTTTVPGPKGPQGSARPPKSRAKKASAAA